MRGSTSQMERLQGLVTAISFQSEETGFTVISLHDAERDQSVRCIGVMPAIEHGESISVRGEWQTHPKFGRQFRVDGYELVRPTTLKGITALLSSGLIPNIGQNRAQKIIEHFGENALAILDAEPERLLEISGIGKKMLSSITEAWNRQRSVRELMLFCSDFGISASLTNKIYQAYGERAKETISENPYALIDDIWGVGFRTADAIAQKLGFKKDSYRRVRAGLIHVLQAAAGEGHVYLPRDQLISRAASLLEAADELIVFSLDYLAARNRIVIEQQCVYMRSFHEAETAVAGMLRQRLDHARRTPGIDPRSLDRWLSAHALRTGWRGDAKQIAAVKVAAREPIMLLTGGPGTGKTTTLQVIVSFFTEQKRRIALAAPTGRAAQRMGAVAGLKAKTIHRLLEFNTRKGRPYFARDAQNPIPAEVIIIDEVSMVDLLLFRSLLTAVEPGSSLIFVGDSNQLPSVGAGNVLADLHASKRIPHIELTTVFRQAAQSRIVTAAHEIIRGDIPRFANASADNCFFIARDDPDQCRETIAELICRRLPKSYNLDPVRDIQALSPMHRGSLGTQAFNTLLQQRLNPTAESIKRGETVYAINDKVMQIHNNYDKGVFNGDIGFVVAVDSDAGVTVDFLGQTVHYQLNGLDELIPAYCISIHKSQGCEFSAVVMPLMTQHFVMLQRNLLYTALTRARNIFVAVGAHRALVLAIRNDQALSRFSALSKRIQTDLCGESKAHH